jgi:hypothetical protein
MARRDYSEVNLARTAHGSWRATAVALIVIATARSGVARASEAIDSWHPLEDVALAALTGGFRGDDGVTISFGIEVEAVLNGIPLTQKALTVGPLALAGSPNSVEGAFKASSAAKALTLILRNSADHQALQVRTLLNISLTELTALRALQTQRLMSSWQAATLRP